MSLIKYTTVRCKMKNLVLLIILISLPSFSWAEELKYFVPGEYNLRGGLESQCGFGMFAYEDGKARIQLGPYHGFFTSNEKGKEKNEKGCMEEYEESIQNMDSLRETILTAKLKITCKNKVVSTSEEMLVLKDDSATGMKTASLVVKRTGEAGDDYTCYWERKQKK